MMTMTMTMMTTWSDVKSHHPPSLPSQLPACLPAYLPAFTSHLNHATGTDTTPLEEALESNGAEDGYEESPRVHGLRVGRRS